MQALYRMLAKLDLQSVVIHIPMVFQVSMLGTSTVVF